MTPRRNQALRLAVPALAVVMAGFALAACGGGSSSSDTTSASGGGSSSTTVSTQAVGGVGDAVIDASGQVLYTNDRDTATTVACTGACAKVWIPLTVPSGSPPGSDQAEVQAKLGTIEAPGGRTQVTYDGKPLYTFVQDGPGEATGDGAIDSFAGTSFTWTAASVGGGSSGATSTQSGGGSGGGGYSY